MYLGCRVDEFEPLEKIDVSVEPRFDGGLVEKVPDTFVAQDDVNADGRLKQEINFNSFQWIR